jgi:hypothetical protein
MAQQKRQAQPSRGWGFVPGDIIQAAREGAVAKVRAIVAESPEAIHEVDVNGFTALHYACFHSDGALVELLLSVPGVNCHAEDMWGRWPVHYSYTSPDMQLKTLISRRTFPPRPDLDIL